MDVINNIEKVIKKIEESDYLHQINPVDKLYSLVKKKLFKVILEGTGGDEALGGYKYNFYQYLKDKYKNAPKKFIEYVLVKHQSLIISMQFICRYNHYIFITQNGSTTDGIFVY